MLNISANLLLSLEMEVKEERKGFEDQPSSDSAAHATVKEAHPEVGEELSQYTDRSLPDRSATVQEWVNLQQETGSVITETTDSGLGSQSAHSEWSLHKGAGNFIVIPLFTGMNAQRVLAHVMGPCRRGIRVRPFHFRYRSQFTKIPFLENCTEVVSNEGIEAFIFNFSVDATIKRFTVL